jgi:hypothetical protein
MGKMKQCPLATLLIIIVLVIPSIADAAEPNTHIGSGYSALDSSFLRCDLSQNVTCEYLAANDNKEGSSPSFTRTLVDRLHDAGNSDADSSRSSHSPRWTVSVEAIIFERIGTANRTLVERVPGIVSFADVQTTPGIPALNSTDLHQGFSPGFRVGATYHADSKYGLELSFFRVSGWDSTQSIGPDNPLNWLVMRSPGFFQTQDFSYQSMTWDYSTKLYNAELNGRYNLSRWITVLAGFRWLQLNENLQGTIPPPDRILPLWKFDSNNNLFDVARIEKLGGKPATGAFPPFWNTSTTNNLYGLQIGADGRLFERGRFSIGGLTKVGGYWNHASESTGVSLAKVVYSTGANTNRAAFVGEAGLQFKYQFTRKLALKLGYEALWLYGVALAPGQIRKTYETGPASVTTRGINCDSGVLLHGGTAGLEFSF